ncbi:MAG: hypothetical protein HOO67_03555 [Candidatus Peribacteraceae bacterium]|nr:hypothetical protein [Candidatus Peribacteraceae bacterium]
MIAGNIVRAVTGFTPRISLLLAAALAAWGFWSTLLLFLQRWKFSPISQSIVILAIAVHPAAFFLVAAYSESLFLLGLIGLIFWSHEKKPTHAVTAIVHGIVMTATRIFGIVPVIYPVIVSLLQKDSRAAKMKDLLRAALISLGATAGMLAFFAYSSVALGKWNLYMRAQEKMWGIAPDYFFLFRWSEIFPVPMVRPPLLYGNNLSPFLATVTFWLLVAGIVLDILLRYRRTRPDDSRPQRVALWTCALVSWYMTAASLMGSEFRSMLRYAYIPYILGVLAAALLLRDVRWNRFRILIAIVLFAGFVAASLFVQNYLIRAFTAGLWVA